MKSKTDYEKAQEFNAITRYLHSHRFNKTLEVLNKFSLSSKKQFNLVYTRGSWKCRFSASDYKFLAKAVFRRFSID